MKKRLDLLLLERGLASSREKAQALIMAGQVLVSDEPIDKSGQLIAIDSEIRLRGNLSPYVSRGGDKLSGAIRHFGISPAGRLAIDVGASTGGFTDCLLQLGAELVYAVDVGYNQLDVKLRQDPRVRVFEKTHAKDLVPEMFELKPDLVTIDVSFISVQSILKYVKQVTASPADYVILVKPQFEVGKGAVGKGGVVKDEALHKEVIKKIEACGLELGLSSNGSVPSELKGAKKGNQEYFLWLRGGG